MTHSIYLCESGGDDLVLGYCSFPLHIATRSLHSPSRLPEACLAHMVPIPCTLKTKIVHCLFPARWGPHFQTPHNRGSGIVRVERHILGAVTEHWAKYATHKRWISEAAVKPEVWVLSSHLLEAISLGSSNCRVARLLEVQLWDIQSSLGEHFFWGCYSIWLFLWSI